MYSILIVDDEPAVIKMTKRAITNRIRDFVVVGEAYNVNKAIQKYNDLKPDVVLTDVRMPGKDGVSLIQYIKQVKEDKDTICAVISGYSDFNYVHDSFIYEAYDYLLKPVMPHKLEDLFKRIREELKTRSKMPAKIENDEDIEVKKPVKVLSREMLDAIELYVKNNLSGDVSINAICSRFPISQPYLSKLFRKYKKCTFNEYVMNLRISEAKLLLATQEDCLIKDIAYKLGFSDQFYFSKVFKSIVGMTPSEYRNFILEPSI